MIWFLRTKTRRLAERLLVYTQQKACGCIVAAANIKHLISNSCKMNRLRISHHLECQPWARREMWRSSLSHWKIWAWQQLFCREALQSVLVKHEIFVQNEQEHAVHTNSASLQKVPCLLRFRTDPTLAEARLKKALENKDVVNVGYVAGQISSLAIRDPDDGWEVYATDALHVPTLTDSVGIDLKATFWRNGYLVFPGLLAEEARNNNNLGLVLLKRTSCAFVVGGLGTSIHSHILT